MPALSNVAITDTFDTWRVRTNQIIIKGNDEETRLTNAFDKANSANVLAFNTGIGANTYLLATIAGANTAVGTGANAFTSATIAGANTAVGAGANAFATAATAGANSYLLATITGANTAVGAGANTFANTKLANTTGTFNGTLTILGNTVTSNIVISGGIAPSANASYGTEGQILTSNGKAAYWSTISSAGFKSIQTFTSSGTWTKPTGVTKILVIATGGGGGGRPGIEENDAGSGGGAGATAIKFIDVTSISSETITIGSGGTASANGGNTTFGAHCTAGGGLAGTFNSSTGTGALGGTATSGDLNINGGASVNPVSVSARSQGGASFWGGGAAGTGKINALVYGAGGSGGTSTYTTAGNGKSGVILVLEY